MPDTKITALAALTGANLAAGDLFPFVDVSDATMAGTGTDKSITRDELIIGLAKAPTQQILTVGSGTYTTPAGCVAIVVEVIAAGGGGGACAGSATSAAGGSGGAGGSYAKKLIAPPAATYAYTVGAKGSGGAAGLNDGTAGADSTFGSTIITAQGGGGGFQGALGTTPAFIRGGVPGGVSTGGDVNAEGVEGSMGFRDTASHALGGPGGGSFFGGGAKGPSSNLPGNAANTPGGGGSGARVESVNTARAGGNGADGLIVVTEFY